MIKFEIGQKYFMKSICDRNCKWEYTVTKRTEKSIWLDNGNRYVIQVWDDSEKIYPEGKYSMSPILRAENIVKEDLTHEQILPESIGEQIPKREGNVIFVNFSYKSA